MTDDVLKMNHHRSSLQINPKSVHGEAKQCETARQVAHLHFCTSAFAETCAPIQNQMRKMYSAKSSQH